jgi:NAD(P)H-dependent FMN reductase
VGNRILVFYGSYRSDRKGIRLADFAVRKLRERGDHAELIDAKAIDLPILDRMLKEYAPGTAPAAIASYSTGRLGGTRSSYAWHNTLSEMGISQRARQAPPY